MIMVCAFFKIYSREKELSNKNIFIDDNNDDVADVANDDDDVMMTMMVIHLHDVIKGPRECQFGFHHAELSQVMTRVGILGTESRTESVYFRHCTEVKHSKEHILAKNTARLHQ